MKYLLDEINLSLLSQNWEALRKIECKISDSLIDEIEKKILLTTVEIGYKYLDLLEDL